MGKPTAVGCYIFAGGFTVGIAKHFNVLAHIEDGDFGVATAKLNWPRLPIHTDPATWPLDQLRKQRVDFVYCNPPCAPWSSTGRTAIQGGGQWKTDPRVACVHKAFGVLELVRPKVWVWESVPRAFTDGRPLVDELTKKAMKLGYAVTYFLTDAQLHGLPQRRQRFHFVAHRIAIEFTEPECEIVTVGEALRGVKPLWWPKPDKLFVKLARATKPGDGLRETYDRLFPRPKRNKKGHAIGRPTWMNYRLDASRPSSTLIGACHALHPTQHRLISPEEQAAICGYPRDFKWHGKPLQVYPQICRAVTPVIGEYFGRAVARAVRQNRSIRPSVNTVDFRKLVRTTEGAR